VEVSWLLISLNVDSYGPGYESLLLDITQATIRPARGIMLVAIHISTSHWVLARLDVVRHRIDLYDSLGLAQNVERARAILQRFFKRGLPSLDIDK
jgi:hypothetical protein